MTKNEIDKILKSIKEEIKSDNEFDASVAFCELASELHSEKKYALILECFNKISKLFEDKTSLYCFELAFAFVESNNENDAEKVYEFLIANSPKNTAVLNNLSNIKKNKRQYKESFDLISRAYAISPDDEIISNNYDSLYQIIAEQKEKEQKFKQSLTYLQRENQFVVNKLHLFIQNAKKDENFKNGVLPLAKWKFKAYMQTDEQKADSLREQWLDKNYISNTGQRGEHYKVVYEINPFIEKAISEIKFMTINQNWLKGIENLNTKVLEDINYYRNLKKINKVNIQFKKLLQRDYDELTFNYLVKSRKSTIILAGSLIETLLIYHLKKKKIESVTYEINNRNVTKDLYDATLNDLLQYLEQNKLLETQFVHLGNISRIFRNYVHPGKELRETEELDDSKADLCYISASELINNII
jgi:Tfp pilus assembly protein PilF